MGLVWHGISVILVLGKLRKEDCECEANLGHTARASKETSKPTNNYNKKGQGWSRHFKEFTKLIRYWMSLAVGVMQMTTTERCHFLCIRVVIRCINVYLAIQQEITDVDKVVKITETLDTAGRHAKWFFWNG